MISHPFKNVEVMDYFPKGFFAKCEGPQKVCSNKEVGDLSHSWLTSSPKFTTFRVNTLVTTAEKLINYMEEELSKDAQKRGTDVPEVYQHNIVKDCIVISPWKQDDIDFNPLFHEVVVDVKCGEAVLRGSDIFAPGVLGMPTGMKQDECINIFADIEGKCLQGSLLHYKGKKLFVGYGIVKMIRKQIFEGKNKNPNGVAIEVTRTVSNVASVKCLPNLGLLQNLPSIVCCHVLNPKPGQKVIDLCASPGNKTSHLAALMENKGILIALDKTKNKVNRIKQTCSQLLIKCIQEFAWDSTRAVDVHRSESTEKYGSPPYMPESFDCVLLDVPCSGLGKRPQLVNKMTLQELKSYPAIQKKLFENGVGLLKVNGTLVYSTCTTTLHENELIIKWALDNFKNLKLIPAEPIIGGPGLLESGLTDSECKMMQRFGVQNSNTPDTDTVGFFIAKLTKVS